MIARGEDAARTRVSEITTQAGRGTRFRHEDACRVDRVGLWVRPFVGVGFFVRGKSARDGKEHRRRRTFGYRDDWECATGACVSLCDGGRPRPVLTLLLWKKVFSWILARWMACINLPLDLRFHFFARANSLTRSMLCFRGRSVKNEFSPDVARVGSLALGGRRQCKKWLGPPGSGDR